MNGCFSMPSPALGFSILKDCCQFKRSLLFWFAFLGCLLSLSFMPVFTVGLYLEGNRRISSSSSVCDISVLAPLFWHQKPSPKENRWSLCFFLGQDPMSAVTEADDICRDCLRSARQLDWQVPFIYPCHQEQDWGCQRPEHAQVPTVMWHSCPEVQSEAERPGFATWST